MHGSEEEEGGSEGTCVHYGTHAYVKIGLIPLKIQVEN